MTTLLEQIEEARKGVRNMKQHMPYLFPEYSRLHCAKRGLKEAQAELKDAQKAWDRLGQSNEKT